MKKKIIIILFFLCFFFFSCKEKILSYHSDGTIQVKHIVLNWFKEHVCWVIYNEDQSVSDSVFWVRDSIVKTIEFRNNRKYVNIYESKIDSRRFVRCYLSDGSLHSAGIKIGPNKFGNWSTYYPNGNIQMFERFIHSGQRVFYREYDEDGHATTTEGSAIYQFTTQCDTIFSLGEKFSGEFFLIDPPDCTVQLYFSQLDEQGLRLDTKPMPVENSKSFIEFVPDEKGTYTFVFDWIIEDKSGEEVLSGSYIKNFVVQ